MAVRPGGPVLPPAAVRARRQPLASPEEAAAYPYTEREREFAQDRFAGQAVGSPETVRQQLTSLLERTGADELMLTTMVYDIEDRIRSFELITEKVAGSLAGRRLSLRVPEPVAPGPRMPGPRDA